MVLKLAKNVRARHPLRHPLWTGAAWPIVGETTLEAADEVQIQVDTHVLNTIGIPRFSPGNQIHVRLAELSETAHAARESDATAELRAIEEEVDYLAAEVWGLSDNELAEIKRSLEDL